MIINKSLGYEDAAIRSIHKLVENEQKELLSSNYPSKVYTCESLELILQYNLLIDVLLSYPFCTSFNHQEKNLEPSSYHHLRRSNDSAIRSKC